MALQNLNQGTLTQESLLAFFDTVNGRDATASVAALATLLQTLLALSGLPPTFYASPAASGFNVTPTPAVPGGSLWLLLTPNGPFALGTITLPPQATATDGQTLYVTCTQPVTNLTIAANGAAAVVGAPAALTANGIFAMRYEAVSRNWYRFA